MLVYTVFLPITLYFPVVFITLDGRDDERVITVGMISTFWNYDTIIILRKFRLAVIRFYGSLWDAI